MSAAGSYLSGAMRVVADVFRGDGWENVILGLGGTKDPSVYTTFTTRPPLTDPVLEALYVQEHFAAKIVEALPASVLRAGWDLTVPGDPKAAADLRDAYATREEELGVVEELAQGAWWGRVFGGAITWIGADDGRSVALELDAAAITTVRFLHTFDRRDVMIHEYYADPAHPKFGTPKSFRVLPRVVAGAAGFGEIRDLLDDASLLDEQTNLAGGVVIHESRCLVWPGQPTTDTRRIERQGWDDSIFERCWDALKQVGEDFGGKSMLLGRISQAVYKITDLHKMIAGKQEETLRRRMGLLEASRSRARAILLDLTEGFENVAQPVAGIDALMDKGVLRLAAAADMPVTILMGQSPAGMDATGESDQEIWTAQGTAWRELVLKPRHERLARVLLLAKDGPTNGKEPDQWTLTYRPLREPSPKERAEVRKMEAETDAINIERGIYTADVAAYRYRPGGAGDVVLDSAELEERTKRRRELANQPPKDNAELGTVGARSEAASALVTKVATGQMHRESAKALLVELFRFSATTADQILGPEDFKAASAPAKTPGPAPEPKKGEGGGTPPNLPGFNMGGDPR